MILKTASPSDNSNAILKRWRLIASLILVLVIGVGANYIHWGDRTNMREALIQCSAETVKLLDGQQVFVSGDHVFAGAQTQSRESARTGIYASRIDSAQKYGLGYSLTNAQIGDRYRVHIWRRGNKLTASYLAVNIPSESRFYKQEGTPVEVDAEEWEKLELIFQVPQSYRGEPISIYAYGGGGTVYLDDFSLERISVSDARKLAAKDTSAQQLDIRIGDAGMRKLRNKREKALYQGILFSSQDDWVKGSLIAEDNNPAKFRFKGDWMDHLTGDKWSFRVKLKEPHAWNRMVTFSVQHPKTRNYLSEWEFHQLLDQEDILTTRFDFVHLRLNGQPKGIYAYEEHFEKQLLEYRARREGPIVKFSEQGVWNARKRRLDMELGGKEIEEVLNSKEAANAEPFKETTTLANPLLAEQFRVAQALMRQYQDGIKPASHIFQLEQLAKYYALTDLTRAYHSLVWHNQRFYFNPVNNKLEPIGYDGFTEDGFFPLTQAPFIGGDLLSRPKDPLFSDVLSSPFRDSSFLRHYIHYLDQYSRKGFVEEFLMDHQEARLARERLIQQEFPNYRFQSSLLQHASRIRSVLFPLNDNSLKVFTEKKTDHLKQLQLTNYHLFPLEVVGWGKQSQQMLDTLARPLWVNPHTKHTSTSYKTLEVPLSATHLFFRMPGVNQVYVSRIEVWAAPASETPYQRLFSELTLSSTDVYTIDGTTLSFLPGEHRISTPIRIPSGYIVHFPAGTSLNFTNGSFFLSQSPVSMIGSAESPIRIYSSDKSAQGFSLIEAKKKSSLSWVIVEDFNTLSLAGWTLTGAVTFYESPVSIQHCSILNNHCEDALNIIRSNFELAHSKISFAYADGLDVDFSTGKIDHLEVFQAQNDGLDFSGSHITLSNSRIEEVGDKGISVGEEATVEVTSAQILRAKSGLVAKDLSQLTVKQVQLEDCNTGFAAYQKKPEYGGASIRVNNYQARRVEHLHLIEQGSKLWLKGKAVAGI
ncbi:MAG: right-handed parallel beta-helix repeat-containing protein [Bacteroidota bacterium]